MIPVIGSTLKTFTDNKLRFEVVHSGDVIPSLMLQVTIFIHFIICYYSKLNLFMQADDEVQLHEWMEAILAAQNQYANMDNSSNPPTPEMLPLSPIIPPVHHPPLSPRDHTLSPRIKSAPNSPFLPVRSASQPVLNNGPLPASSPRAFPNSNNNNNSAAPSLRLSLQRSDPRPPPLLRRAPSMKLDPITEHGNNNTILGSMTRANSDLKPNITEMNKQNNNNNNRVTPRRAPIRPRRARATTMIPIGIIIILLLIES